MNNQMNNRILIIDDNEAIHRDFRKILEPKETNADLAAFELEFFGESSGSEKERFHAELLSGMQGEEGCEILTRELEAGRHIQMAFVDMRMPPGIDGVETIERLWKIDPTLQVVICTAYSDHSWEEISSRLQHPDQLLVLKKPYDEVEVLQMAESLCNQWRAIRDANSHRQKLEGELEEQQKQLQNAAEDAEVLIQSVRGILVNLDSENCVLRWNPAAAHAFGIETERAIGNRLMDLPIEWDNKEELKRLLLDSNAASSLAHEVEYIDPFGMRRTLDLSLSRVLHDDEFKGWLLLATDVTEKKMLVAQLDQAQRLESVGQLAAGVAHEINTPMQYIGDSVRFVKKTIGKLQPILDAIPVLLEEDTEGDLIKEKNEQLCKPMTPKKFRLSLEDIEEAMADALRGVNNVSEIVAAMKEFSHPGTDEKCAVSLNHILQSTITVAKNEWKYVAEVETDFDLDLDTVPGYPGELNQVFLNILVNASHAIAERVAKGDYSKGEIFISTRRGKDCIEIDVSDNGGGIPVEIRHRVFEPFFTTKAVGKGTGQGLAIAFNVINQKHQGRIWCDVVEGESTTFHVRLPVQDPEKNGNWNCNSNELVSH